MDYLDSNFNERDLKKSNTKVTQTDKLESAKPKAKETTPKNAKVKEPENTNQPVPTIDTTIDLKDKPEEPKLIETEKENKDQSEQVSTYKPVQVDFETVVKTMTLDDIFINLNLIAKIEIGDKLYINDKFINIDMSYVQPLLRWYYGIDRKSTIHFVRLVINKSFDFCEELTEPKMLFRLNNDLKNSIVGLTKLKQTYITDKLVQAEIDVIIEDIRSKIESNLIIN